MSTRSRTGIERRGAQYAIVYHDENGTRSELVLPKESMLALALVFPRLLQDEISLLTTDPMSTAGIAPVIRATVVAAELNVDVHNSEIHLQFEDDHGHRIGFGIAFDLARQIGERLIGRTCEASSASKSRH